MSADQIQAKSLAASEFTPITSAANAEVKLLRSLHERKYRRKTGWFLAEGMRICMEALESGAKLTTLTLAPVAGAETLLHRARSLPPKSLNEIRISCSLGQI